MVVVRHVLASAASHHSECKIAAHAVKQVTCTLSKQDLSGDIGRLYVADI